ncbi:MAG: glycoside hydrolase family 2 [Spirochaetaceae bacterium]|jgi:beta-galactosidase/beta-glucuronidase|nr:glycoside hydrolase family 2 [Spirochaetaceae bacterium]
MKSYQPDYPRPQFVRGPNSWINLNGVWDFVFDDRNEGTTGQWFRSFPGTGTITVPFTYETPKSGVGDPARHQVVWYHRKLPVDPRTRRDTRVVLHFEGSDYHTELWVNGDFAGVHDGAYARFSFDITRLVRDGENDITLRVEDSFDTDQPRGKQRWKDESFGCWYVQTTGIWKTIWLEYVPPEHIVSVKMTPLFSEGKLKIEADVRTGCSVPEGPETGPAPPLLEAAVSFKGIPVTSIVIPATKKHLEMTADLVDTSITEWGFFRWEPENPQLYDISFRLLRDGTILDEVLSYFGMREIRIDGPAILLNGVPLYQRLILDQGYWKESCLTPPDEEALITDINKVLAAGYNGVRKHQKIEDERFLYWADVKGLLVWSEMAAAYEYRDRTVRRVTREWMEILQQNYNHPSIIIWVPFNESWGVPAIKTSRVQQCFTEAIYYLTKSYDPCRPVITNDGWEHTVSDVITLHDYEERGEDFFERYSEYLDAILGNVIYHNRSKSAFAQNYGYRGQPLIISEFGGIAFSGDAGWGYGNKVRTKEEFIKRFDAITTAIKKIDRICGYCYTQLTDVQQEINGLMDMDRNFKVNPDILKEINQRLGSTRYKEP